MSLATQGHPSITVWCPVCMQRCIPILRGICGFCDTPVGPPRFEVPVRLPKVTVEPKAPQQYPFPGTIAARALETLRAKGPATTPQLCREIGARPQHLPGVLRRLESRGLIERVGRGPARDGFNHGGRPSVRWGAK